MARVTTSPLAGQPAPKEMLVDPARLEREYYARKPDIGDPNQLVVFGTSGHRGSPLTGAFTDAHIAAITQAICDYRRAQGIDGPLYMGKDTHAVSEPAQRTALEVLVANGVETIVQRDHGVTPTPVISRAILVYNRARTRHRADGVVVTPSHNPPEDGGFKYNPPHGGPADTDVTQWIEERANTFLRDGNVGVRRVPYAKAIASAVAHQEDLILPYVRDLENVVDMAAIRGARLTLGVDPLGGAAAPYWEPINSVYDLDIAVVNPVIDPTFSFMTVDHDGKIRMDPSSPYAMARLVELKDRFRVAFANDCDADRHGIVTRSVGLMNPNHYLAVAIRVLADASATLAGRCRGRQDAGEQQHDRSGRGPPRPPAGRGPRGLQVVRARAPRRIVVLRRRGERGSELPPSRWRRLGHRQGRSHHGSPRGGDHRAHGQGPRRALPRADGGVRGAVLHAHRRAGGAGAEGQAGETVAGDGPRIESRR